RDHKAEWQQWESWLQTIEGQVTRVPGVRTEVERPGRSNVAPTLSVTWDLAKVKITGAELKKSLNEGAPRIWVPLGKNEGISIMPYMMQPGEDKIVAQRLQEVLSAASARS